MTRWPVITVKTKGFKELEANLAKLEKQTTRKNVAIRALTTGAEPMALTARRYAPKDEDDLEKSITVSPVATNARGRKGKRGGSGGQFGDIVQVFIGIDPTRDARVNIYSQVQEFGNENNPAQPFMRPAFEGGKFRAIDHIADALKVEIGKAIGRQERKAARS